VHIEAGGGADITNEQYYEDAFIDSTFLGRRSVTSPETRYGGIMVATIQGTRGARRGVVSDPERAQPGRQAPARYPGHQLARRLRDGVALVVQSDVRVATRSDVRPRSGGMARGAGGPRLRRGFIEATTSELAIAATWLRCSGQGSEFLLDRNTASASIALDHLGIIGDEWRIGYALAMRALPGLEAPGIITSTRSRKRWRHVLPPDMRS
jgi:hypothetical protein